MKNTISLRTVFPSLAIASCMIIFGGNVAAQTVGTLPSAAEILARVSAKSHPRTVDVAALESGVDYDGRWIDALTKVKLRYAEILPVEPVLGANNFVMLISEIDKTVMPGAVWLSTQNATALAEAKRRALNLASWSPSGSSGFIANDLASARITQALALSYDWLHDQWTPAEKKILLSSIHARTIDILGTSPFGLDNGLRYAAHPIDSHRSVLTANTAVICTTLAGVDPIYDKCVKDIVPGYLALTIPWGSNDGGFANGVYYATFDVSTDHFDVWSFLKQTIAVDLWQTPWAKNYGKFIAYFLPPDAPAGVFGDGAEVKDPKQWGSQGKAYAGHLPSPLSDWYASSLSGEEKVKPFLLLSPQTMVTNPLVPPSLPIGTPQGIHIPSIGWTAMHSDLGNELRTSVYFKSSPFGAYVHSHADQNSFIIHSGGKVLAADSGYYDGFNTPHFLGWYKQTKAHNAITFDGGQGQTVLSANSNMAAKGKITQFQNTTNYDLVSGDAGIAYGGAFTKAVRSMVYLRPNTLVVFDSLASATPRTWEWNIHALEPIKVNDARNIEITQGDVHLCVSMVNGPDVAFNQTDLFTPPPAGTHPDQSHGTFSSTVKSNTALFVTVLEVGCGKTPLTVVGTGEHRNVSVLGNTLSFDGSAVTVHKNSTTPIKDPTSHRGAVKQRRSAGASSRGAAR